MGQILGRYDEESVHRFLADAGVFEALERKGFVHFQVEIDSPQSGLPHVRVFARKHGRRFLLLDASVIEIEVPPLPISTLRQLSGEAVRIALVYWVREEDPTADFPIDRPALPLQQHPGLGVLRRAFRAIVAMARARHMDGVACVPKFFHDAVIFFRSRLFLFLDGREQGRFEALLRDLHSLPLGTASLGLLAGKVRDERGQVVSWNPGYQVFPLSERQSAYFHSETYAQGVRQGAAEAHFTWCGDRAPAASDGDARAPR